MFNMDVNILEQWTAKKIGTSMPYSQQDLENYQLRQLNKVLQHIQKCKFYRSRITKSQLSHLSELRTLPFTTSDDLVRRGHEMVCVSQEEIERIVTINTSGSTGEPKRIFFTKEDLELTIDFFCYGLSQIAKPNEKMLIMMSCKPVNSVGDLVAQGIKQLGVTSICHGNLTDFKKAYIEILNADSVIAPPIPLLALGRFAEQRGFTHKLKGILVSSDFLPNIVKSELSRIFSCPVFNHYGLTESGLGAAVECHCQEGMHIREADLLFEIVDHHTGKNLPDGILGEIVITTITRKGMPLIRYRTGDYGCITLGRCNCGMYGKRLAAVEGRISGIIYLGNEEPLRLHEVDEVLFSKPSIMDFRLTYLADHELHLLVFVFPWTNISVSDILKDLYKITSIDKVKPKITIELQQKENWSLYNGKRQIER